MGKILYINNKVIGEIKTIDEMSKHDAEDIADYQPKYEFNTAQATRMIELVRMYVDPQQPSCAVCGTSIRDAKNKIVKLFQENKAAIIAIIQDKFINITPKVDAPIEVPIEGVKNISKEKPVKKAKRP